MARPKAARDKAPRQTAARKMAAQAAAAGLTPLALMLEVMREHYAAGELEKAVAIAEKAAPYVHAKLAQIDASLRSDAMVTHRFVMVGASEAPSGEAWEVLAKQITEQRSQAVISGQSRTEEASDGIDSFRKSSVH